MRFDVEKCFSERWTTRQSDLCRNERSSRAVFRTIFKCRRKQRTIHDDRIEIVLWKLSRKISTFRNSTTNKSLFLFDEFHYGWTHFLGIRSIFEPTTTRRNYPIDRVEGKAPNGIRKRLFRHGDARRRKTSREKTLSKETFPFLLEIK